MNRINDNALQDCYNGLNDRYLYQACSAIKSSGIIPFSGNDATCGIENEFQTAVSGRNTDVDLPRFILNSNYLRNLVKRINRGDLPSASMEGLKEYLEENENSIWENSWVRFPGNTLSAYAKSVLQHDLKQDKKNPSGPDRKDISNFFIMEEGVEFLRVPVSYMLKLALADTMDSRTYLHPVIRNTGIKFLDAFLNDNTSPEIVSFFPVTGGDNGRQAVNISNQTLKSYLLTQLLIAYANKKFELSMNGQEVSLYFSPHPPVRQKKLNDLITDSFYRELFMSPCLSGWDRGEEKYSYMNLCHQVLSRSSLNSILKLKEAGIIPGNRVYLRGISNISLANNGTHISIGSKMLSEAIRSGDGTFTALDEKYNGDLAIKIFEHFIPLFTGTYSASPYRLSFHDFHPEKILGFLSHELDFTHLRMLWRKWQYKANIRFLGNPLLPSGPEWFEAYVSGLLRLKGDYVSDFRMIDFPVSLLSTDESPLFNGEPGSGDRLKKDLSSMGIFDSKMSVYTLYRMRSFANSGFTGFEGRYYSLFESIGYDLAMATDIQVLVTALAWKYILDGEVTHGHIPDTPETESERRQAIFAASIGLPSFYVKKNTQSIFMKRMLSRTKNTRVSNRYPGYLKVYTTDYMKALTETIKHDAAEIIESMGLGESVKDLMLRISNPQEYSASHRLTAGILKKAGASTPLGIPADEFNLCAERYYREELREKHIMEAFSILRDEIVSFDTCCTDEEVRKAFNSVLSTRNAADFIESVKKPLLAGNLPLLFIVTLIHLILLMLYIDMKKYSALEEKQ